MHFFFWYYTTGLVGVFRIAVNALRFIIHRFNLWGLVTTLVSPWKRDVAWKTWRGFHPLLWLQAIINNALVRFLGLLVRLVVIGLGVLALAVTLVLALALSLLAPLAPPLLLATFFIGLSHGPLIGGSLFVIALATVIVALYGWRNHIHRHTDYSARPERAPWRDRFAMRLGFSAATFPDEVFHDAARREAWLTEAHLSQAQFDQAWAIEAERYDQDQAAKRFWDWESLKRFPRIGKYWTYAYTPHLDRYSVDLTDGDYSSYGDHRAIGRERVIELLTLTLVRPTDNSALIVGSPGAGKHSIVHALARSIRENAYDHPALDDARVVLFDLGQIFSDGRSAGTDPKALLREILDQAVAAGNIILVIDTIELYLDPASEQACGEVLHEYLQLPTCRVIGLMTSEAHHTIGQHQIPALKYFETITLEETNREETIQILLDTFHTLEAKRPVFTWPALETIYAAAERHNWDLPFPERAIDLAQQVLLAWDREPDQPFITQATVENYLEAKSGIPMGEATAAERDKLLNLETLLHERVIGQDEAIKQMAEAFRKVRAGLGNDKKPIGSFLFLGPTGVGKTETAKALAAVYFGDENRMVRLDMSEFQTEQAIAELIGSAERNVEGRMTTLIKEHPYSILLLDELEKAYPRALDLFLQILDEGFVTDGFGHRVSFRNTIIIATSNAGAGFIHEATAAGQAMAEIEDRLIERIISDGLFRPEFLNRFDGVILFQALTDSEMIQVTRLKLEAFAKKLYEEKKITMTFSDGAIRSIIERGYKPEFGARSINRYIADVVEDATVKRLLQGELAAGATITFTEADLVE